MSQALCTVIHHELTSGGAYENVSACMVVKRASQLNLRQERALPLLCGLPKMHKNPFGWRFLALSGKCATKPASQVLSKLLTCILETLREKNDHFLLETGIRRFFIISDPFEATDFLASWRRKAEIRQLHTFDFSTMYTTIPLEDLCTRLNRVIDEAFDSRPEAKYENMIEASMSRGRAASASWVDSKSSSHTKSSQIFSSKEVKDLVYFVVMNTFILNGGKLKRQKIGIPMGTNSAPNITNLYLYSYESDYIDLLVKEGCEDQAQQFNGTFRLIDDCLSVDNPLHSVFAIPLEKGGVYPASLTCSETSSCMDTVNFCGAEISGTETGFRISVYDKKKDFPFAVKSYPHTDSNIPRTVAYSAFVGQLNRFYRICNHPDDFIKEAVELASYLIQNNGCTMRIVKHKFSSFLRKTVRGKYHTKLKTLKHQFETGCTQAPAPGSPDPGSRPPGQKGTILKPAHPTLKQQAPMSPKNKPKIAQGDNQRFRAVWSKEWEAKVEAQEPGIGS